MRAADGFVGFKSVRQGPAGPNATYCGGGINQDAVQIEKQSTASYLDHD